MAIIDKHGNISGKFNGRFYYIMNGKQYVRSIPVHVNNPRTSAQMTQRQKQTLATGCAKKLTHLIKIGYQQSKMDTPRHEFISHLVKNGVTGTWPDQHIDYSLVRISRGLIVKPFDITVEKADGGLILNWKADLRHAESLRTDKMVLLLINDRGEPFIDLNLACRDDETVTVKLPKGFTGTAYAWVFYQNPNKYTSENKTKISDSVYLGCY